MRVWFFCLLLMMHPLFSEASPELNVNTAWDGLYRVNHQTEVQITLQNFIPQQYIVTITGGKLLVKKYIQIFALQATSFTLPVQIASNSKVLLDVTDIHGASVVSKVIWFDKILRSPRVLLEPVVDKSSNNLPGKINQYQRYQSSLQFFPQTLSAMNMADVMLLKYSTLRQMTEAQLNLLLEYISACGVLITQNLPESIYGKLKKYAVCDAFQLQKIDNESQLSAALATIENDVSLSNKQIVNFINETNKNEQHQTRFSLIGTFISVYVLLMFVSLVLSKRQTPPLIISLCFTVFLFIFWKSKPAVTSIVNWMEMSEKGDFIQLRSIVSLNGGVKNEQVFELPDNIKLVDTLKTDKRAWLESGSKSKIVTNNLLFSENAFLLESHLAFGNPIKLRKENDHYFISHAANINLGPGLLIADQHVFYIPVVPVKQEVMLSANIPGDLPGTLDAFLHHNKGINTHQQLLIAFDFKLDLWKKNSMQSGWLHINADRQQHMPELANGDLNKAKPFIASPIRTGA